MMIRRKQRKKHQISGILLILLVVFLLVGCGQDSAVILSLPEYTQKVFYTEGVWQDFTDYGIYTFAPFDEAKLEENLYFEKVTDVENILSYFENFEGWLTEGEELSENYNFDKVWVDENDYVFINTEEGRTIGNSDCTYGKFDCYSVYFFDTDTWTLYYIHNNI